MTQIFRKLADDFCPPARFLLAGKNFLANVPIEENELTIDREHGTLACLHDAGFQFAQPVLVGGAGQGGIAAGHAYLRPACQRKPQPKA